MQKNLSIFTAYLIYLAAIVAALAVGYSIGYSVGAEVHDKGDMGTGIAAGMFLFLVLPVSMGLCAGGIFFITKILNDIYDKTKIAKARWYLSAGLILAAIPGLLYPILNSGMWQY